MSLYRPGRDFLSLLCLCLCLITHTDSEYVHTDAGLTEVPVALISPTETVIDLRNNQLSDIAVSPFPLFPNLMELTLIQNSLTAFPDLTSMSGTLEIVRLSQNQISHIDPALLDSLVVLKHLGLNYNRITAVPDVSGPPLSKLQISHNHLSAYPDVPLLLRKIRKLQLGDQTTPLGNVPDFLLTATTSMTQFYASNVSLTSFPDLSRQRENIRLIGVGQNLLRELPIADLLLLTSLEEIDVRDNVIATVNEPRLCEFSRSGMLLLGGNPLQCDCRLRWLKLAQLSGIVSADPDVICDSPDRHQGALLADIPMSQLTCDVQGGGIILFKIT